MQLKDAYPGDRKLENWEIRLQISRFSIHPLFHMINIRK